MIRRGSEYSYELKSLTTPLLQVSRIQLESGDKLARLSLEIEGESEGRVEMERKVKEMRTDVSKFSKIFFISQTITTWNDMEIARTRCSLPLVHLFELPVQLPSVCCCVCVWV